MPTPMMRAAQFDRFGPPEVLHVAERPVPTVRPGHILVEVHATTVQGGEMMLRAGKMTAVTGKNLPRTIGTDFTGRVAAVADPHSSRAQVDHSPSLGLGPLGVLPSHQRRGVGSALMHAVLAAADALDLPEAVLLGDPGYYARFGFQPAQSLGVMSPDPAWGQHFQLRTLTAWTGTARGTFRYAPAFGVG